MHSNTQAHPQGNGKHDESGQQPEKDLVGLGSLPTHVESHDFPATPVSSQQQDPFASQADLLLSNSSKKIRSKPTRNASGVLIRKDGRPDMRSVSSANNLRKVHAKREAERAEADGPTPTSARSLAPAESNSMSGDERDVESGTPDSARVGDGQSPRARHQELMSRMFPRSGDGAGQQEAHGRTPLRREQDDVVMKEEQENEEENEEARPQARPN
ncbi:hypothetical protein B0A55_10025 [Friedmanniomyces simplex]|uniref:Uncharacterized protein n=1 Tax=Friedmanniomyces simplex TaxID=329884 RepID=A0A4U0WPL8_9PEZI|nr:hypothetical protein B0A55_10025 [Friedmanniomyces simplex]